MMAPELHADDLLDKEARGELSAAERVRLDRHVEACSVCRFERQVRDDFRLEFETLGQAARKEANQESTPPFGYRSASRARPKGRLTSRARLVLLAAAATLVASAAAAEWETLKRTVFSSAVMEQGHARSGPALPANGDSLPSLTARPLAAEPPAVAPAFSAAPVESSAPSTIKEAVPSARRAPAMVAATPIPARNDEPATQPSVAIPATADTLFAAANDERQQGAYDEAIRLYRDLSQRFAQSSEAIAAHAILGRLLLDRGDPSGALVQFDQYLQSGHTTLGEEATVGRASALQRLGRSVEEGQAWSTLLANYPQSVHAPRARSRLAALGNR